MDMHANYPPSILIISIKFCEKKNKFLKIQRKTSSFSRYQHRIQVVQTLVDLEPGGEKKHDFFPSNTFSPIFS